MGVDLTALAGIVCGTGMITVIGVSIARAISRSRDKKELQRDYAARIKGILKRLESLEARVAEQDFEVKQLREDNRFLNKLLKDNSLPDSR